MRAAGASWSAAATEAGWGLAGLKTWIRDHPRLWARELGRARRDTQDAACDEAVSVLRKQLRGAEAQTILRAAIALAGRFAPRRGPARPAEPTEVSNRDDLLQEEKWQRAIAAVEEADAEALEAASEEAV